MIMKNYVKKYKISFYLFINNIMRRNILINIYNLYI